MKIPKPRYKIGDVIVIGQRMGSIRQCMITTAHYLITNKEWEYTSGNAIFGEKDVIYKLTKK